MSEGVRREGVSALERVGRARKCWPKQGKTNGMYPKSLETQFSECSGRECAAFEPRRIAMPSRCESIGKHKRNIVEFGRKALTTIFRMQW